MTARLASLRLIDPAATRRLFRLSPDRPLGLLMIVRGGIIVLAVAVSLRQKSI